jgi:Domain of unknown function (DUF4402)
MGTRPTHFLAAARLIRLLFLLLGGVLAAVPATAQTASDTVETEARATVITVGSLASARGLHFGDIIPGSTGGTVTVTDLGARTSTGGVTLAGTSHHPALFVGLGRRNQQIELSFRSNIIQITGPGSPMTVTLAPIARFNGGLNGNRPGRWRISASNGMFSFPVGGTLSVNANQTAGYYTGTFEVLYEFQ